MEGRAKFKAESNAVPNSSPPGVMRCSHPHERALSRFRPILREVAPSARVLVFDYDGTLADTAQSTIGALIKAVREYCGLGLTRQSVYAALDCTLQQTLVGLMPWAKDLQSLTDADLDAIAKRAMARVSHPPQLFRGLPDLLAREAARGMSLAVYTASPRERVVSHLERAGEKDNWGQVLFRAFQKMHDARPEPL